MLIDKDSVLRRLPLALDKRQLRTFDAIRLSIEMYDVAYQSILGLVNQVDRDEKIVAKSHTLYPLIFLHAWSMVDSANRLRLLLTHLPGVSRGPHFEANFRKLIPFENMRNPIQHLNKEILVRSKDPNAEPILGSLSWSKIIETKPLKILAFLLLPGTLEKQAGRPLENPASKSFHGQVDHVELSAYGETISLSDAYYAISNLAKIIETSLQKTFDSKKEFAQRLPADLLLVVEVVEKQDVDISKKSNLT
jgi:hypothetical protein